jgi:hypothetical protein
MPTVPDARETGDRLYQEDRLELGKESTHDRFADSTNCHEGNWGLDNSRYRR